MIFDDSLVDGIVSAEYPRPGVYFRGRLYTMSQCEFSGVRLRVTSSGLGKCVRNTMHEPKPKPKFNLLLNISYH